MSKAKAIAYGIGLILAAVGGFLVAALDDDAGTKPDPVKMIEGVKAGVGVVKESLTPDGPPSVEPEPVETGSDESKPIGSSSGEEKKSEDSTESEGDTA